MKLNPFTLISVVSIVLKGSKFKVSFEIQNKMSTVRPYKIKLKENNMYFLDTVVQIKYHHFKNKDFIKNQNKARTNSAEKILNSVVSYYQGQSMT